MSTDARNPAHPQRLAPPRPPAPANTEPSAKLARSDRRIGLTPISLLLVLVVGYLLIQIQFVLVLVLLSLVFATVIQTPVDALDRRHVPRPLAILLVYVAIIGAITVLFMLLSPAIREQATAFREQAPQSLADLRGAWQESGNALLAGPGQQLLSRGIAFIESPGQTQGINVPQGAALGLLTGLGGGIIGLVTVLIISFYYLMEKSWIRRIVLLDSAPETRIRVSRIWDEVEQKVGDWLRGQLTLCLVIGVTATDRLRGARHPVLAAPRFVGGSYRDHPDPGAVAGRRPRGHHRPDPGMGEGILVIGFVVLLQLTENAVLVPRVMRGAVGLTPLTVFIAILAGTELAGIPGALLAIPIAAVIQVLVSHYSEARREAKLAGLSALPGWRWMRGSVSPPAFSPLAPVAVETSSDGGPAISPESTNGAPGWSADVLSRTAGRDEESGPGESNHS